MTVPALAFPAGTPMGHLTNGSDGTVSKLLALFVLVLEKYCNP